MCLIVFCLDMKWLSLFDDKPVIFNIPIYSNRFKLLEKLGRGCINELLANYHSLVTFAMPSQPLSLKDDDCKDLTPNNLVK